MTRVEGLGAYIREQRERGQISLRQLSLRAGISNPYLSQIERGLRQPSAEILQQIAHGLRISAEALYVRAGILEERVGDRSVIDALRADAGLTERQKQVLVEIYDSFRAENRREQSAEPDAVAAADEDSDAAAVAAVDADAAVAAGAPETPEPASTGAVA